MAGSFISYQHSLGLANCATGGCTLTVEQLAEQALSDHVHFVARSSSLKFTYLPDLKTLRIDGCLPTYYLKQIVQETLRELPGVEGIDNRISVVGRAALIGELEADRKADFRRVPT